MKNFVDSVKDWFDQPGEIKLRVQETDYGLTEAERKLLRPLSGSSRILDIGCAAGRASISLAKDGHDVIGIDVSKRLVQNAKGIVFRRDITAAFQVCEPIRLPFRRACFDAVLLFKTYCYIPKKKNRVTWLNEIARVINPGGWFFISQYVIDDALGSYQPIDEENQSRFPNLYLCGGLEQGDGFTLPSPESGSTGFVHYFMEADLMEELASSQFQIENSFRDGDIIYCALKTAGSQLHL